MMLELGHFKRNPRNFDNFFYMMLDFGDFEEGAGILTILKMSWILMILKVMLDFDFEGYAGILVALKVMLGFDAFDDNAGIFTILKVMLNASSRFC